MEVCNGTAHVENQVQCCRLECRVGGGGMLRNEPKRLAGAAPMGLKVQNELGFIPSHWGATEVSRDSVR